MFYLHRDVVEIRDGRKIESDQEACIERHCKDPVPGSGGYLTCMKDHCPHSVQRERSLDTSTGKASKLPDLPVTDINNQIIRKIKNIAAQQCPPKQFQGQACLYPWICNDFCRFKSQRFSLTNLKVYLKTLEIFTN